MNTATPESVAAAFFKALDDGEQDPRIAVTLEQRVLWLRIERPAQHNALALSMLERIARALRGAEAALRAAPGVDWLRLAVITGAGHQSFAAGGDLKELNAMRGSVQTRAMTERGMAALNAIRQFSLPVIAGLNGTARGGGAELAMACDWRVAHSGAGIGFIQGRLNLSPAWGGGTDLMRRLGSGRALRILAEADVLNAADALALGMIEKLLTDSADDFAGALAAYVRSIAQRPPQILHAHKALAQSLRAGADEASMQQVESAELRKTWDHPDHWQAAAAAMEKSR